ncbi:hypothetical protein PR202_ga24119 [Eleusine coracana subsp. coracana]|uniref:Subtilisin-like protease fibronectin type-III domain-containing protein n=1 Tax=Eleusine coracana subsp. coracana TaxID=191504 RepID=A0AAV5D713_ELECO|nr:hypothetical protein PR202_ga24119 [Eleusine coracana subsp. coracana]
MTTADAIANNGEPIADHLRDPAGAFATGAGHVNATRAVDPGLVYDIGASDYAGYLCTRFVQHSVSRNSSWSCSNTCMPKTMEHYGKINLCLKTIVFPHTLSFTEPGERHSFFVAVQGNNPLPSGQSIVEGSVTWVSAGHRVRSTSCRRSRPPVLKRTTVRLTMSI